MAGARASCRSLSRAHPSPARAIVRAGRHFARGTFTEAASTRHVRDA
ncbi:hypothetical protein GS506_11960 [Rhodococcus hoagii]|nr:hypothetical protein [Prescottella equi]